MLMIHKMVGMDGYAPSHIDSQSIMLLLHHNPHKMVPWFLHKIRLHLDIQGCIMSLMFICYNENGWLGRSRTYDMRINSALLLPLSY